MRRTHFTCSLMAVLLLSACVPNTQSDAQSDAPGAIAETPVSAPAAPQTDTPSLKLAEDPKQDADLPEMYQGLDPIEITRAEIDELIDLQAKADKDAQAAYEAMSTWREQNGTRKGPRPTQTSFSLSSQDEARLNILNGKLQNAEIRKKYETADSTALTEAELQELIRLEQAQAKSFADFQKKIAAWNKQDPATRGPMPEMDESAVWGSDPRYLKLQTKFENADNIERMTRRVEEMSATYNISLSDTEMSELTELETEQAKFEAEFAKAMIEAEKQSQLTGVEISEEEIIKNFPKDLFHRMIDMEERKQEIMAPLEAAKKADKVQTQLAELSEASGVPILSGEISESIALSAERDRIENRTQFEAIREWMAEGGPLPTGEPLPNDEDYARLKEIDARLKEISAPMTDAKNAALEADNPALRKERLDREAEAKWRSDWRDQQQAGTIPLGTPMTSPTYAELQDRVTDYGAKLKARADKVGYAVPETDIERLDKLNSEMLAIRKSVYEMEKNGSSHKDRQFGYAEPSTATVFEMQKVKLIQQKQREILAGLTAAESLQNGATETETNPFSDTTLNTLDGAADTEAFIEEFLMWEIEVPQSEIDDLRAFAKELASK